jgi:hypothetical protein
MQNNHMSFFEECLTLGRFLSQAEKEALYRFLLQEKQSTYRVQANNLLKNGSLTNSFANGVIQYRIESNWAYYISKEISAPEFTPILRKVQLNVPRVYKIRRLERFFAQAEVDVLSNFPLPGENQQSQTGYGINAIPYYDLNYYSNGKGRALGWLKKIKSTDSEILTKLRTL